MLISFVEGEGGAVNSLKMLATVTSLSLLLLGCTTNEAAEIENKAEKAEETSQERADDGKNPLVVEAVNRGKLALADGDIEKALSNFRLALIEEPEHTEATAWLNLIELYQQLVYSVDLKEVTKAEKALAEINEHEHFPLIGDMVEPHALMLEDLKASLEELNQQIAELEKMYDPHDETAMPDENYLAWAEMILENHLLTDEQKTHVERIKQGATERADKILAAEHEKYKESVQEEAKSLSERDDIEEYVAAYRANPWYGNDEDPEFTWNQARNIIANELGEEDGTFVYNGRLTVWMDDLGRRYYSIWKEDVNAANTAEGTIAMYDVFEDFTVIEY